MSRENTSIHLPYVLDETNRSHYYENHWKQVALKLLADHEKNLTGKTLLDYGCGRGETLEYAAKYGLIPTGLDIDPECVRIAARKGPAQILDPDRIREQVGARSYDIITCFHVLEHVENPKEVLSILSMAAREYVLVAVPNLRQINNLRRPWREPGRPNEGHLQSWDHPHFRNLAENHCGLELVSWGFDATILPAISELTKRTLGNKWAIKFESGLFRKIFPFNSISVIALLKPAAA